MKNGRPFCSLFLFSKAILEFAAEKSYKLNDIKDCSGLNVFFFTAFDNAGNNIESISRSWVFRKVALNKVNYYY